MDSSGPSTRVTAAAADGPPQGAASNIVHNPQRPIAHTAVLCGLAENPALPHELIDVLIRHGDEQILTEIAAREDLTDQQIESLAASGSLLAVTSLVNAGRIPLPPELLDDEQALRTLALWNQIPETHLPRLALHPDPQIREAVAHDAEWLPPDAVRVLAADEDVAVVIGIAGCADLPEDLARALAAHPDRTVRSALATNLTTPPEVLGALAETGGHPPITTCGACRNNPVPSTRCGDHAAGVAVIQDAALRNGHTPTSALALHIGHPDPSLRSEIAERADLPPELLAVLADDPEDAVRASAAANPTCPTRLLRALACDRTTVVRRAVALNPQVPLDLLYDLAAHTRLNLRAGIPAIENATLDQIHGLARSRSAQLRALAASRTDLPEDLVKTLADDPDTGVVKQLADHPSLDADDVRLLVARHGPRIYSAAARNPNCPPELLHTMTRNSATVPKALREIARHPAAESRTLLLCLTDHQARPVAAAHPHLPAETLAALLDDPEWTVANNAAANPSLPTETMRARITAAATRQI